MKEYKAYPGIIGYSMLLDCLLPYLIGLWVVPKMGITENMIANEIFLEFSFLLVLILILRPCLFLRAMVNHTALVIDERSIIYRSVKFEGLYIFKKPEPVDVEVPWNSVQKVSWLGSQAGVEATNGPVLINTDRGDIRFWVIFHDRTNAEIMREIVKRMPHLTIDGERK